MATHTIYGCYIPATGAIEFSDATAGCDAATITGCLLEEGEHAGQVQITHDYAGCETQYYACYDPTTGKFSVDIDDECCGPADCTQDCSYSDCPSAGPAYIKITFDSCNVGTSPDCTLSDTWVVPCSEIGPWYLHYELPGLSIACGGATVTRVGLTFNYRVDVEDYYWMMRVVRDGSLLPIEYSGYDVDPTNICVCSGSGGSWPYNGNTGCSSWIACDAVGDACDCTDFGS